MNTAPVRSRVRRHCSMQPLAGRLCAPACHHCNYSLANSTRMSTRGIALISGSNPERLYAPKTKAFTGFAARNRHRPRD